MKLCKTMMWLQRLLILLTTYTFRPSTCLDYPTLEQAIECFDAYTVSQGRYNRSSYSSAQPTPAQRTAWQHTISSLLDVDNDKECLSLALALPAPLANIYHISLFTEPSTRASFCILSEHTNNTQYAKGWGLFAVPATTTAARHIHISAPHPAHDLHTPVQAAALFKSTGAKSLLIPGRSRAALEVPTDCVAPYHVTDPVHNNLEPFFDATLAIYTWQLALPRGCPASSCAFIQFHGKGPHTCPSDHIFLSAGLGTDPASLAWYTSPTPRPIKRLHHQLQRAFPGWTVSLPSLSPSPSLSPDQAPACPLLATKNVPGRLLNGVPPAHVCSTPAPAPANDSRAGGFFVHVEQAAVARSPRAYAAWGRALKAAFEEVGEGGKG
ncbi:hypothetical protein D9615_007145 [Tricholomella constricta]|uniref:Uncharacterized protein n=1 Tax=Tricholomella constricta TaxID=117010 RepID=A0A8H5M2S9_9AGAR|nr:hypothetical protein D9615_007145 [Tricholomella constricta]